MLHLGKRTEIPILTRLVAPANIMFVLALLSCMGKVNAAAAAASMRSSYGDLGLVIVVGMCDGVPYHGHDEILLGDVVISQTVVQYDFGRKSDIVIPIHSRNCREELADPALREGSVELSSVWSSLIL